MWQVWNRERGFDMRTVLEAKNLCKTYIVNKRQNNVLKNVNLTVEDGEMVAVEALPPFLIKISANASVNSYNILP